MSSIILPAGAYTAELRPAATVSGIVSELAGDTSYKITISYYNTSVTFSTRPTVDDGALTEFPRFS